MIYIVFMNELWDEKALLITSLLVCSQKFFESKILIFFYIWKILTEIFSKNLSNLKRFSWRGWQVPLTWLPACLFWLSNISDDIKKMPKRIFIPLIYGSSFILEEFFSAHDSAKLTQFWWQIMFDYEIIFC